MTYKTALIGCGRIGFLLEQDPLRNKPCTHYGGASKAGLKITHACDINDKRLAQISESTDIPLSNLYPNSTDLLSKENPEIVIIATWTDSHDKIAVEAARNGAKIIILEKPIASSLKKAENIIKLCRENSTNLIINHERRYDSRYRKLKKIIESEKIGQIKCVHASILTSGYRGSSNIKEGGGPLLHDGTHLIDIIRFLFGNITELEGEFHRDHRDKGFEDRAVAWLKTESGIDIFLEAGGSRNYFVFELEISGTEGKIVIGNGYEQLYVKKKSQFYTGFNDITEVKYPKYARNNCFTELYKEVKKSINNSGVEAVSTGLDGYKSLEVIHGIYLSSHYGRKKYSLPISASSINLKKIFQLS